jgi:cell shape-determining protein MreD
MEIFEMVKEFIKPELLVLIPVLYIIGVGFKKSILLQDRFIPVVLGLISIFLSGMYIFATTNMTGAKEITMAIFTALTQGVLLAGASVYANQIYKQFKK